MIPAPRRRRSGVPPASNRDTPENRPRRGSGAARISLGGENEERDEAFAGLGNAAVLAAFVVLLILIAQFRSYGQALVILSTIPFSLVGAAMGL